MQVQFNRDGLSEALGLLTSVVLERTPKPILKCIKISATKEEVRIFGTDLEVGINYLVRAVRVEQEGEVVVSGGRLAGIVRESADEVLSIAAEGGTCEVWESDSHFTIYGHEAGQYPEVPGFEGDAELEVGLENLQSGISQVLFATARESTRYAINGVLWEIRGKKLSLVATDGRRLARSVVSLSSPADTKGPHFAENRKMGARIIVPAKTMALLDKLGGGEKEIVGVKRVDNRIVFRCGGVIISSNLVEGKFPMYEDIIPSGYEKKLRLPTEEVLSAVRRAALLTSVESRGIKLSMGRDSLVFSGRAPEAGDAEVKLAVAYKGEPIEIGFNPQFLTDVLRAIKESEFELELGQADTPGVIKSGANFLYVLMPINIG